MVLIDSYQGIRLNSPNDLIAHSNGSIWFTGPTDGTLSDYEGHAGTSDLPTNVYRLDPATGGARVVVGDIPMPNGLCFSPDQRRLYVVGQPPGTPEFTQIFDVVDGRTLANGRLFLI